MVYRYVPILRVKAGEKAALHRLSSAGKRDVTPLLIVAPSQVVGKKATKHKPALPGPVVLTGEIQHAWSNGPFYLDASALVASAGTHPFDAIAHCARTLGLSLIPATVLGASASYQAAVMSAAATDGRGVALRINLQEATSATAWISTWSLPPSETDLIIDLADNVSVAQSLGAALIPAFSGLYGGTAWRSVTFSGSSMPENFSSLSKGLYSVPRIEWALWQMLSSSGLPYRLDYGDYATVSTVPAPTGIAWGFPINAKYSLPASFLICRGVRTEGLGAVDMDIQLQGHANDIAAYSGRSPLAHCWGDTQIDKIATKAISPSGLTQWVGFSVNRHLELTRQILP